MKPKVYIETSVISYLTADVSADLVIAARQYTTHRWWKGGRKEFDCFASRLVFQEASCGDPELARRRLEIIAEMPELAITKDVEELAEDLVTIGPLPRNAANDAIHIAVATVHGLDYLLSWNQKHIANIMMRDKVESTCRLRGYRPLAICTPDQLVEGLPDV